jgi:hypothetical protein
MGNERRALWGGLVCQSDLLWGTLIDSTRYIMWRFWCAVRVHDYWGEDRVVLAEIEACEKRSIEWGGMRYSWDAMGSSEGRVICVGRRLGQRRMYI